MWFTDGTAPGTNLLDTLQGIANWTHADPVAVGGGGDVVLGAWGLGSADGYELWAADDAGAQQILDVAPGAHSAGPSHFTRAGDRVFFTADHPETGRELHAVPVGDLGAWVAQPFGAPCGLGSGGPTLALAGAPVVGGAVSLELSGAAPSAPALVHLGSGMDALALGGGCTLYLEQPLYVATQVTDGSGASRPAGDPARPAGVGRALGRRSGARRGPRRAARRERRAEQRTRARARVLSSRGGDGAASGSDLGRRLEKGRESAKQGAAGSSWGGAARNGRVARALSVGGPCRRTGNEPC